MRTRHGTRRGLLAVVAVLLGTAALLQGCNAVETKNFDPMEPPPGHGPFTGTVADWPLWFVWHQFGAHCFDTQACDIRYAGGRHGSDQRRPSMQSFERPLEKLLDAGWGPIRNFPPPAEVQWISLDGTPIRAEVDMSELFADRMVRHSVAREDILEDSSIPYPGIILVVDDRTIRVYMSTWMALKRARIRQPT